MVILFRDSSFLGVDVLGVFCGLGRIISTELVGSALDVDVLSAVDSFGSYGFGIYGFGLRGGTIMLCHVLPFEVKARSESL